MMEQHEMQRPAVTGYGPRGREQMARGLAMRLERRRARVAELLSAMSDSNAEDLLSEIADLVRFYPDHDEAAAALAEARDSYKQLTGRRAPRRYARVAS